MKFDSKRARHLQILQSVKSIESWDLAERSNLMVNTSNKYVKYLRDEGYIILTEGVEGKENCKYVFVSGPKVPDIEASRDAEIDKLIKDCLAAANEAMEKFGVPRDHRYVTSIHSQVERLRQKQRKAV